MTVTLSMLLVAASLGAKPAPPAPGTAVGWVLGAKPAPGAWATYDTETRADAFVQKTRVTFLYLGAATVEKVRGDWLEIQEELKELKAPGMPEPAPGAPATMVTRVLLAPDGRFLRTVSQRPGSAAEESVVGDAMSITIGALSPFEELRGKLTTGSETVEVTGLGPMPSRTSETAGEAKVKIWQRASDGLCVKLIDSSRGATSTYALVVAGSGGKTRISGPVRAKTMDPEMEQFLRMQKDE
jgi:hypothetical protein